MTWIQTYTGVQFWPLQPRAEDVELIDIAHALANTCRFGGHCREFYSVAQHSVYVANALRTSDFASATAYRAALLHDAAEAYLPDVCRPIKHSWETLPAIEARLLEVIFDALDVSVSVEVMQLIKRYDDVLLATEARDLLAPHPAPWVPLPDPLEESIEPVRPVLAEEMWLDAWHRPVKCGGAEREA